MTVRFLRVLGVRSDRPTVLAIADGHRVGWDLRRGWTCTCPTDDAECPHVDLVAALLDPRVLGVQS